MTVTYTYDPYPILIKDLFDEFYKLEDPGVIVIAIKLYKNVR